MPIVTLQNGLKVNFDQAPTPADIQHVVDTIHSQKGSNPILASIASKFFSGKDMTASASDASMPAKTMSTAQIDATAKSLPLAKPPLPMQPFQARDWESFAQSAAPQVFGTPSYEDGSPGWFRTDTKEQTSPIMGKNPDGSTFEKTFVTPSGVSYRVNNVNQEQPVGTHWFGSSGLIRPGYPTGPGQPFRPPNQQELNAINAAEATPFQGALGSLKRPEAKNAPIGPWAPPQNKRVQFLPNIDPSKMNENTKNEIINHFLQQPEGKGVTHYDVTDSFPRYSD